MRDVDCNFRSKLIVRQDAGIRAPSGLAGKTLVLGSRDAAEATVLPLHFLKGEGLDLGKVKVLSLDGEVDLRGNPCSSEVHVLKALQEGRGQAGIIGERLWERLKKDQPDQVGGLVDLWTSPPFSHCVFTAGKDFDEGLARAVHRADAGDGPGRPADRRGMRLEGTRKWVAGSPDGFRELLKASTRSWNAAVRTRAQRRKPADKRCPHLPRLQGRVRRPRTSSAAAGATGRKWLRDRTTSSSLRNPRHPASPGRDAQWTARSFRNPNCPGPCVSLFPPHRPGKGSGHGIGDRRVWAQPLRSAPHPARGAGHRSPPRSSTPAPETESAPAAPDRTSRTVAAPTGAAIARKGPRPGSVYKHPQLRLVLDGRATVTHTPSRRRQRVGRRKVMR